MLEDEIISGNIQLGEISELSSTKMIDIVINVPDGTDHSLIFEYQHHCYAFYVWG